jgi:multiple sugar transport system substrate-binding protein
LIFNAMARCWIDKKEEETSMKTRKIVALLLSVLMVMSLATAAIATEERIPVTYAFWGTVDEAAAVTSAATTFNESQDRIQVEVMPMTWETFVAEFNAMAVAGTLPDASMMNERIITQWAVDGMLADVSQMYADSPSKPLDSLAFMYEGTPVAYSTANEILLMYYNRDMFDAAGVAYPSTNPEEAWSWDEFVAVAKQLTFDVNGLHPDDEGFDPENIVQYGCMVENLTWQLEVWCLSNGGGFYSEDGKELRLGAPESIEAIQKVADLHTVHHVAPLSAGATDDGVQRSLIAGNVAMTTNGAWNVGTCLGTAKEEGLNYGVAPLPYMKDKLTLNTSGAAVVYKDSPNPEAAMEWVKWYTQVENSWDLISTGIWMPNLEEYYTNEELTHKWVDNPNFPPYEEYKAAVVDYAMAYARPAAWYYVPTTDPVLTVLYNALGDVWTGSITAEQAITENLAALESAFKGE